MVILGPSIKPRIFSTLWKIIFHTMENPAAPEGAAGFALCRAPGYFGAGPKRLSGPEGVKHNRSRTINGQANSSPVVML